MQWGDRNTKWFHKHASMRKRRNDICGITTVDGTWVSERKQIEGAFDSYFTDMFRSTNPSLEDIDDVLQDLQSKVMDQMNSRLIATFTRCEVERAIKQMHPTKSPGPDGFSTLFYKKILVRGW